MRVPVPLSALAFSALTALAILGAPVARLNAQASGAAADERQ